MRWRDYRAGEGANNRREETRKLSLKQENSDFPKRFPANLRKPNKAATVSGPFKWLLNR